MGTHEKFKPLDFMRRNKSNILIIGVVGAVGSGTSWVSKIIESYFDEKDKKDKKCYVIKASNLIEEYLTKEEKDGLQSIKSPLEKVKKLQELGDNLRKKYDSSFLSAAFIKKINDSYGEKSNDLIFIIDSLKNPAEVDLLRIVYGESFWLIGNVCSPDIRKQRLKAKFKLNKEKQSKEEEKKLDEFIARDEDDRESKHGQHVSSTFEKSDYFVNTTEELSSPNNRHNWSPYNEISRFIKLVTSEDPMLRPTDNEHGMYSAYAAKLGSACLSRQVGATLMNSKGEVLSTGCNEVPRAGGGLYGQSNKENDNIDNINRGRCYLYNKSCKNTEEKNKIVKEIIDIIFRNLDNSLHIETSNLKENIKKDMKKSKVGDLIEFSRSVHAEMDALISAARKGISTDNCRLFVTTYPCHNCARHIVAAGIKEVQFIEPYLKSKAMELHCDSITQDECKSIAKKEGGMVLFKPYEGAAPRLYKKAFLKDREVKDASLGRFTPKNDDINKDAIPERGTISRIQEDISNRLRR